MKFGKTYYEEYTRNTNGYIWFAWYPVRLKNGKYIWLEWIFKKYIYNINDTFINYWEYSEIYPETLKFIIKEKKNVIYNILRFRKCS
jgi:hypothetical protein